MNITLEKVGKKYRYRWIFRGVDFALQSGNQYGITGSNGSGKSTLLKIIAGYVTPSTGKVLWTENNRTIGDQLFKNLAIASPHLELIEDFSLEETLAFHKKLKPWLPGHGIVDLLNFSGLERHKGKPLKYFSSGMKQRVKIMLALMSHVPLVLLDEPCSNLDEAATKWYQNMLSQFAANRLVIIASNDIHKECPQCKDFIRLE